MRTHLLAALLFAAPAWAADATPQASGVLKYIAGDVRVQDAKGVLNQSIVEGQSIHTGPGSAAIVSFSDGSQVKLNPSTTLKLNQLKQRVELGLQSGAVFSQVKKQAAAQRFIIRTETAVMGVRGTQFFTSFGKETAKGSDLWMCVNEGSVEVETIKDSKKVLVKQGEGILVPAGKELTPPKPYGWTKSLNWNMEPEKGEIIDRTKIEYDLLKQNYD